MNYNKYLILTILLSVASFQFCYPQLSQIELDNLQTTIKRNTDKESSNIKGSPFVNEDFEAIKIKRFGDKIFYGRYNAYLSELQIKQNEDIIVLNNNEDLTITFLSRNKIYITNNYIIKEGKTKRGFLNILKKSDSLSLYKEEVIKFYEEKPSKNGYDKAIPAQYKRAQDNYYFKLNDGNISYLPIKKKEFLKLFPEYESELKSHIKSNKLSLKKEADLIKIFEYLSTIIE